MGDRWEGATALHDALRDAMLHLVEKRLLENRVSVLIAETLAELTHSGRSDPVAVAHAEAITKAWAKAQISLVEW